MSGNIIPQTISGSLVLSGPSTSLSLIGDQLLASVPPIGNYSQTVLGLNLAQTVWDGYPGGIAKATVQQGFLGLRNAELAADANQTTLLYQIKQAYYAMLSAQRNLAVFAQNLELQKSALEQEQTLYDLQQAEDVDLQTAKINEKSAEIDQRGGQQRLGLREEGAGQYRRSARRRGFQRGRDRGPPDLRAEPRRGARDRLG